MLRILAITGATAWLASGSIAHATCPNPIPTQFTYVTHAPAVVMGFQVERYVWYDTQCRARTASIKLEGSGNSGHGGYAVQMTYQVPIPNTSGFVNIVVPMENSGDGGFGYFVSHERYRTFTDGTSDTIADKVFNGADDSPLGLEFPAPGAPVPTTGNVSAQAFRINTTYYHYGTVTPIPLNSDGNDSTPLPLTQSSYARYAMPITLTWTFQTQTDAPRYDVDVDLTQVGQADRVSFDLRAPYGVMVFDDGHDANVDRIQWGDRWIFDRVSSPVTRNSSWYWNTLNPGGRFNAMVAGLYEMGLYEPVKFASSHLQDGYADERGSASTVFNHGNGCAEGETQILPCDFEWPYQGLQFSLPTDSNTTPTNFKKIAWGSTAYYGAGSELTAVYDTNHTSEHFVGFPASKHIDYSICILLGRFTGTGLTRAAAAAAKPNCASTVFK